MMRRRPPVLLFVALVLMVPAPGVAAEDDTRWRMYQESGDRAFEQGRFSAAEELYQAAVGEATRIDPSGPRLVQSLQGLAKAYRALGDGRRADEAQKRAAAITPKTGPRAGNHSADVLAELTAYAKLLRETGYEEEAGVMDRRAAVYATVLSGASSRNVVVYNPVPSLRDHARLLRSRGDAASAARVTTLLDAEKQRQTDDYRATAATRPRSGFLAWESAMDEGGYALNGERYADAAQELEAARDLSVRFGPTDFRRAHALSLLARAYTGMGRPEDALRAAEEALPGTEAAAASGNAMLPRILFNMTVVEMQPGTPPADAVRLSRRTLAAAERAFAANDPTVTLQSAALAHALASTRDWAESARYATRAVPGLAQVRRGDRLIFVALVQTAEALHQGERFAEAEQLARELRPAVERSLGLADDVVIRALGVQAGALRALQRGAEADTVEALLRERRR